MGGVPADIYFKVINICDDASKFPDVMSLAQHAQNVMQRELDMLYVVADSARVETAVS